MPKDYSGIDEEILEAIQSYDGIPNAFNLSKEKSGRLRHSAHLIASHLKKNTKLQEALETRGLSYVETCDRIKFDESIVTCQWTNITGKVREAIDNRIDRYILEAIQS